MTSPRRKVPTTRQLVNKLRSERQIIEDKVRSKVDVLASMIGVKMKDGIPTDQIGITYFVSEKVPLKDLPRTQRIPKFVDAGGLSWPTDVLVLPIMATQAAPAVITYDGNSVGTLSCFATANGRTYGLTCGHCIWGSDKNPTTPTDVSIFIEAGNKLVQCGRSVLALFSSKSGLDGRGFIDCGVFSLETEVLQDRGKRSSPLQSIADVGSLVNTTVYGVSTQKVSPSQQRTALVHGVDEWAAEHHSDIVLCVDSPGTFPGDSGMLWLTRNGRAVGLHTRGEPDIQRKGSSRTTAMSAARAADKLGVKLRYG